MPDKLFDDPAAAAAVAVAVAVGLEAIEFVVVDFPGYSPFETANSGHGKDNPFLYGISAAD